MIYLHDAWINWFEGEEKGYNVPEMHEWRKSDGIELLDQVPLVYVNEKFYDYIENDLMNIPQEFLDVVENRAYLRKNQERIKLKYAFVITDGRGVLAVDTMDYNMPIRKSRLIPRQERLVFDMVSDREPENFKIPDWGKPEHNLLSPDKKFMIGLTRKEKQLKQLLFMALDQLNCEKDIDKLKYFSVEWNPNEFNFRSNEKYDDLFNRLFDDIKNGWSEYHERFTKTLTKGQPFFEKLYHMEANIKESA